MVNQKSVCSAPDTQQQKTDDSGTNASLDTPGKKSRRMPVWSGVLRTLPVRSVPSTKKTKVSLPQVRSFIVLHASDTVRRGTSNSLVTNECLRCSSVYERCCLRGASRSAQVLSAFQIGSRPHHSLQSWTPSTFRNFRSHCLEAHQSKFEPKQCNRINADTPTTEMSQFNDRNGHSRSATVLVAVASCQFSSQLMSRSLKVFMYPPVIIMLFLKHSDHFVNVIQ